METLLPGLGLVCCPRSINYTRMNLQWKSTNNLSWWKIESFCMKSMNEVNLSHFFHRLFKNDCSSVHYSHPMEFHHIFMFDVLRFSSSSHKTKQGKIINNLQPSVFQQWNFLLSPYSSSYLVLKARMRSKRWMPRRLPVFATEVSSRECAIANLLMLICWLLG